MRGLFSAAAPRHLRDLARDYAASPAGVAEVINRLKDAGVVIETRRGNRRLISLTVSERERQSLASLYRSQERFTRNVDFALVANAKGKSRAIASQAIKKLGMKPVVGFVVLGDTEETQ